MPEERTGLGITLPPELVDRLDRLRLRKSRNKELAGRDRSAVIEILIVKGLKTDARNS